MIESGRVQLFVHFTRLACDRLAKPAGVIDRSVFRHLRPLYAVRENYLLGHRRMWPVALMSLEHEGERFVLVFLLESVLQRSDVVRNGRRLVQRRNESRALLVERSRLV